MFMDFQKTERPLENSTVYIVTENNEAEGSSILAVFASKEAAQVAVDIYIQREHRKRYGYWYEIKERVVLDKTPISEGQRQKTTAVGEGSDPSNLPATGAG